jgi:hypothetical protein
VPLFTSASSAGKPSGFFAAFIKEISGARERLQREVIFAIAKEKSSRRNRSAVRFLRELTNLMKLFKEISVVNKN